MTDHPLVIDFGLNPDQARAATLIDEDVCVEAGAGSGKTRVLVARLVGLLEPGQCELNNVVAITFTRKAASEMRERLRSEFRKRANSKDIKPEHQSHWRDLIRRLESARINTIDGFCASILREHAVRLGIDPDFTVLDESETILLRDEAVRTELMQMLEENHDGARRFAEEFGVDELVESVLHLVRQGRAVQRAVQSMPMHDADALFALRRGQVENAISGILKQFIHDGDLDALCAYLESLEEECSDASDALEQYRARFLNNIRILTGAPTPANAARALMELCSFHAGRGSAKKWSAGVVEELRKRLGALRDLAKDASLPEFDETLERRAAELVVDLYAAYARANEAYQNAKRRLHAMDFGDLLAETVAALRRDPELQSRLRNSFKHLLIDEFQDTDPIQFEMVLLLRKLGNEPGAHVFIVGDVKQSIYGFRGADVDVFDEARDALDKTVELPQNYRSDPAILNFVNEFYQQSGRLTSESRVYKPLAPHRTPGGFSRIEFVLPEEDPDKPGIGEYRRREATLVAQRLLTLCNGDAQVFDTRTGEYRPARFGDVALLFRKHTPMPAYEQVLREHGVPFVIEQGRGYFDRQEIHDVVNLLKFIANPWDETALVGYLRSPLAALSDEALMELKGNSRLAREFYGNAELSDPDQNARLLRARNLVAQCHAVRHQSVSELLHLIYETTGFESAQLGLHHAVQRASNVRKLLDSAAAISATRTPDLHAFIRFVSDVHAYELVESEAPWVDYEGGAVTLMTVHKSKGLEFPIVVLADTGCTSSKGAKSRPLIVDRRFGIASKIEDDDGNRAQPVVFTLAAREEARRELAEEARVLYVAMTRAKDHLLISGSPGPKKDSWLAWLDETFGVMTRSDGDDVAIGDGTAHVTRTHAAKHTRAVAQAPQTVLDPDALIQQAQPLSSNVVDRDSIGVHGLLDLLVGEFDPEVTGERDRSGGMDPLLRGQILHKFFEEWTAAPPEYGRILESFALSDTDRETVLKYLEACYGRFVKSPLYDRYRNGDTLQREVPFMVAFGDAVLSGVIDALLPDGTIVDYKTGAHTPGNLARYTKQLQLYAAALRSIVDDPVTGAILYFADTGETVEVDVSPTAVGKTLDEATAALAAKKQAG